MTHPGTAVNEPERPDVFDEMSAPATHRLARP